MILLYGRSATLAASPDPDELMTLAAWRESGMLGGVVVAAIAPTVLFGPNGAEGYGNFGLLLLIFETNRVCRLSHTEATLPRSSPARSRNGSVNNSNINNNHDKY